MKNIIAEHNVLQNNYKKQKKTQLWSLEAAFSGPD